MTQLETLLNKDKTLEFIRRVKDEEITFEELAAYRERQLQTTTGLYLQLCRKNIDAHQFPIDIMVDQEKNRIYTLGEILALGALSAGNTRVELITADGIESARMKLLETNNGYFLMQLNRKMMMTGIEDRYIKTQLAQLVSEPNIIGHPILKLGYKGVVAAVTESFAQ